MTAKQDPDHPVAQLFFTSKHHGFPCIECRFVGERFGSDPFCHKAFANNGKYLVCKSVIKKATELSIRNCPYYEPRRRWWPQWGQRAAICAAAGAGVIVALCVKCC